MASWKKLIVSGSDAVLSTVTVDTVVCGNLCGVAESAASSCIVDTDDTGVRYLTFVSDQGSSQQLNIDKTTLSYAADTNLLAIGSDSSAPGAICFIAGTGGTGKSISLQTQALAFDTIVCFPDTSGVMIVDQGNQTIGGIKTFSACIVASGGVCGEASSAVSATTALNSCIVNTNAAGTKYLTFVSDEGNSQQLNIDKSTLSYEADTNLLAIGADSSAPGAICFIAGTGGGPAVTMLQTQPLAANTIVCFPDTSGVIIVDQGAQKVCGVKTFVDTICLADTIIEGDLTVNGTTTYLNTTNLAVEDRFVLLNSGSNTPREAGLVVDEGAPSGSGHAFVYDANTARWGFTASLDSTTGSVVPDAFVSAVVTDATCGATEYCKVGNIFVCTSTQDIYIYS